MAARFVIPAVLSIAAFAFVLMNYALTFKIVKLHSTKMSFEVAFYSFGGIIL